MKGILKDERHRERNVKRTIAARSITATLFALAFCAAAYAQDSQRVAPARARSNAKSNAVRTPHVKTTPAVEDSQRSDADGDEVDRLLERNSLATGGPLASNIKSRITRGRVEMSESPVPGTFESYEKE